MAGSDRKIGRNKKDCQAYAQQQRLTRNKRVNAERALKGMKRGKQRTGVVDYSRGQHMTESQLLSLRFARGLADVHRRFAIRHPNIAA